MNCESAPPAKPFGTAAGPLVFSGHESFACRYGWLPKLYQSAVADPQVLASPETAILRLGIGRNMVKSIRFWAEAAGLLAVDKTQVRPTALADRILDPALGIDPHLETHGALWRLHWMLTVHARLGAWAVAFLETHDRDISKEAFVAAVAARAAAARGALAQRTATNHVDVFLRTYAAPSRFDGTADDLLASPFQELALVRTGTRAGESIVHLARGPRPTLTPGDLAFALNDFWAHTSPGSSTVSLRSLMLSYCAPGAVFLLDEPGLHQQLDALTRRSDALNLEGDGAGGLVLACSGDPHSELQRIAWPQ